jgi:prepilin-type N-terminal cleavage/methylation domain-containing protein
MSKHPCGFTLIELLIVVAIIAILAGIAVPNFLEAQVRAKVARVKADQRSLAPAIESYAVDSNVYPIRRDRWDLPPGSARAVYPPLNAKIYDPALPAARVGMHVLTTPVSYITSLPKDIFNQPVSALAVPGGPISDAIDYWDPVQLDSWLGVMKYKGLRLVQGAGRGWALVSVGPDRFLGTLISGNPGGYPPESFLTESTARFIYDPTNGTVSSGNIYRFAGDLTQTYILEP